MCSLNEQVLADAQNNQFRPIAGIKGQTLSFLALTANRKLVVFNTKLVDDWLIRKYNLTHYLIPKLPVSDGPI